MEKAAIGTNDLGMHIVIRPISKDLLSKDEIVGMETGKINSLLTARRPITLVDAISALPPLLPSSADPITGRRLYSVDEIMSGSCGIHFGPPVPELLRYETELSANTVLESSIASARSAAKRIGKRSVILEPKISMPRYSERPLMKRAERPLSLHRLFLPRNMQVYSMGGTTKQKGTICFVRKLAVRNEAMRKIS